MKEKLLHERALVTCIIMLFVCIILKLFGVQWFDLNTDIPILQEIDKIVMNSEILSFTYSLFFKSINCYLLCIVIKRNKNISIPYLLIYTSWSIVGKMLSYPLGVIAETLSLFLLCNDSKKSTFDLLTNILLCSLLSCVYQIISLVVRDINVSINGYNCIIVFLMNIDYYIMLIITYLMLKKGDKSLWELMVHFGSSLANLLWKKRSKNYSNKEIK